MGCSSGSVSPVSIVAGEYVCIIDVGLEALESDLFRCCNAELGDGEFLAKSSTLLLLCCGDAVSSVSFRR